MAIINPILKSDLSSTKPTEYVNSVIQTVLSIFMLVAVIYFIWHFIMAGYHLISSQGDPKKYEQARDEITYALLGLAVCFSVFAILKLVGVIFGITGLENLKITWPSL